jgi:sulfate adenylyltransferase subunit 2
VKRRINPIDSGSSLHTQVMKTEGLKRPSTNMGLMRLSAGSDEEKSRAKERIFSFRNANHAWDPKNQWPEL